MFNSKYNSLITDITKLNSSILLVQQRLDILEQENKYLRNKILRRFKLSEQIGTDEQPTEKGMILPTDLNISRI